MSTEQLVGSILAVDCGTILTKAALLDRVDGAYRLVARGEARTTVVAPWQDIILGVQHAIEQVEDVTNRVLLSDKHQLIMPQQGDSTGVDIVVAISSAARPLRVILAGLAPDLSLASAARAVAGTYSNVRGVISQTPQHEVSDEEQIRLILKQKPDVVCIVGGVDSGAIGPVMELVRTTALACSVVEGESRPLLLFAGNTALRQRVVEVAGSQAEVRSVDNVYPRLDVENPDGLRVELDTLYREQRMGTLPGVEFLTRWSHLPIIPSAEAFARIVQYLWHLEESPQGVLGIDLGANNTTVAAVFDGRLHLTIHGGMGSVYGGQRLIEQHRVEALGRWIPTALDPDQIVGMLMNRMAQPASVPESVEDLWVEQAVAREMIRQVLQTARPGWRANSIQPHSQLSPLLDTILISGGALVNAARPGQVALIALDAVEPVGVSTLLLDSYGLAPSLGAVAAIKPLATVETLDNGGIVNLATAIVPVGTARKGDIILRVRIHYQEGGALDVEVPYGSLEVLPLPLGQEAVLELQPRGRFDVGLGGPGKGGKRSVHGGIVGLIIDARGRPLQLPANPERRQAQVQQWLWDIGG
jgi:hypothetical protein